MDRHPDVGRDPGRYIELIALDSGLSRNDIYRPSRIKSRSENVNAADH
jgi:hypothetical protein